MLSGTPAPGQAAPTPVAKANADAACPDGHDVERGIVTWRASGTACWSGRRRSPSELEAQHRLRVQEAVVVARGEDGQVVAKDRVESSDLPATAGGGLLGLLIGVIGGPLGVLVGGTYGLFVGSMFDRYDAGEADTALGAISGSVEVGQTALLAVVDEPSPDVVAAAMADLGGTVARRSVADVEAELAAAEDAERKAKQEARKELDRQRREHDKTAVNAKVAELKAKLQHGHKTESADADPASAAPSGSGR